jgi:hypothetical protein
LKRKQGFEDLGVDYFDKHRKEKIINQSLKRLEALGLKVTVEDIVENKENVI